MKVKSLAFGAILLLGILPLHLGAQGQFSAWSVDPTRPTLQARYLQYKASDGYRYIKLEITSSIQCRLQVTSTLCNNDPQDRNTWKNIKLEKNKARTVYFKVLNSCINGWWWWYRHYHEIIYTY
jgi:hypothetical protein